MVTNNIIHISSEKTKTLLGDVVQDGNKRQVCCT